jgi:hypothetical protein
VISDQLRTPSPQTDESAALNDLLDERQRLTETVRQAENRLRFASADRQQAAEVVTDLERRSLGGDQVSASERKAAERALAQAQAAESEPWRERAEGARRALSALDRRIATNVGNSFDALRTELEDEARESAARIDRALEEVIASYEARERVAGRLIALCSVVGRSHPGDVEFSRAEAVVREAGRLLGGGGEAAPILRRDPRQPRSAAIPGEPDERTWAFQ